MPIMNFELQDGMPPVSFSINGEGAERMMNFMSECQQDRDAHAMLTKEIGTLRSKVESLAADAEMYQWLKNQHEQGGDNAFCVFRPINLHLVPVGSMPDELDETIKEAMAKEKA